MKILIIGSGGREHALCQTLRRTTHAAQLQLICAPGNDGIAQATRCVPVKATDIKALARLAEAEQCDLTVVGSEAPLAAGLVDEFTARGLLVAGPLQAAAQLEASKVFAKEFMARHGIPTARFRVAASAAEARAILRRGEFGGPDAPVVVKADGLAAGKGVVVAQTRGEAEAAVTELMEQGTVGAEAARRLVLEETLTGREVSLLLWTDGVDYALMPPARDHKRVGTGDTGPNTGGMGAITAPDILDEVMLARVVREIVEPTLAGARADALSFRGVLFIGLMLTPAGPQVLEYNVRLGDPEAQALLVRLDSDLAELCAAVARGRLRDVRVAWTAAASACVVLAARGYPARPETGARIDGLAAAAACPHVQLFHAGTRRAPDGTWLTNGGRVLGVTAVAPTLPAALARCYEAAQLIHWDGLHYRPDIGQFTGA